MFDKDEYIRCDKQTYNWMKPRIVRDKKMYNHIKKRNPDELVFPSYKSATRFIHENFLTHVNSKRDLDRFFR